MEPIEMRAMRRIARFLNGVCSRLFKNCRDARHIKLSSVIHGPGKSITLAWVTYSTYGKMASVHIGPYEVWRKTAGLWHFGCRKEPSWPRFFELHRFEQ